MALFLRRRAARGLALLAGTSAVVLACASLDDLTGGPAPVEPDAADASLVSESAAPVDDAGGDATPTCPPRYMPEEGTYSYGHFFSADILMLGDASLPTEPFKQPFFATVRHGAPGCWTFTAYLSSGPNGRHDHAWVFCNRCDDAGTSLDLVAEKDYFISAGAPSAQLTTYTCGSPNAYISAGAEVDASLPLAPCTGQTSGAKTETLQITPLGHQYLGITNRAYAGFDGSVPCETYNGRRQVQFAGGGAPVSNPSNWQFELDSGLPMANFHLANTTTSYAGLTVTYQFSLVFNRTSPTVSPLITPEDGGL